MQHQKKHLKEAKKIITVQIINMKKFFIFCSILFLFITSNAQLLVVHTKYKYVSGYINNIKSPYYLISAGKDYGIILFNLDNSTILFNQGNNAPLEISISKWRFDPATSVYYCTVKNPNFYKWQSYEVHVNKENEADYVTEKYLFTGRDLKNDTNFIMHTGDLSLVHITETYSQTKLLNGLRKENAREILNFDNLLNQSATRPQNNDIEMVDGIITWKCEDTPGNFYSIKMKVTSSQLQQSTLSKGILFKCKSIDGSNREFELFYGSYGSLKGLRFGGTGPIMYIREMKDGMPEALQFFI